MVQFIVKIGQYEYRSEDARNWRRTLREIPPKRSPLVNGSVEIGCLPMRPGIWFWDVVTVLPSGLGVAAGHYVSVEKERRAFLFVTSDAGQTWRQEPFKFLDATAKPPPAEEFTSAVVRDPQTLAISWQDPWLFDRPESHVVFSHDEGLSWEYSCLDDTNPHLALAGDGRILASNAGYFLESRSLRGTWQKSTFDLEWPDRFGEERVALLRHITFISNDTGYALIVLWPAGYIREIPVQVGLVATEDGGVHWHFLHVFEGPNVGDVNERHITDLRIVDERIVSKVQDVIR